MAAALVLASGGLMVITGVLAESDSWVAATLVSLLGAVVVQFGFRLAAAPERSAQRARPPNVGGLALMTLSGFLMAAAGYQAAAGHWWPVAPLVVAGGITVLGWYVVSA